jgi:Ca2+-binding EF-hand superfamily protein
VRWKAKSAAHRQKPLIPTVLRKVHSIFFEAVMRLSRARSPAGVAWETLHQLFDKNRDGLVTCKEFLYSARVDLRIPMSEISDPQLIAVFELIDANNNETVEMEELLSFLKTDPAELPTKYRSVL